MGGRPAKAAAISSGKVGAEEKEQRKSIENKLRGNVDKIVPPKWLTPPQKKTFRYIVMELAPTDILSNLDIFLITQFSVATERLVDIERSINDNPLLLLDKQVMSAKDKYSKDLYRCISELSLSPQARAKIGTLNLAKRNDETDPILTLLSGKGKTSSA